ncbi:cell division protein FtsZ [Flavipsychrobacter stenotrophus]|uniref:Cell division protein FtsZ n=1 Tax=Flavipsychrobacter stenotrophus TaxID=2077091 RepID=A0A2S7SWR2_9BACT|nr:cell division protein FtsZ [Flavipsychrobacter stenotrophus]PQJ10966.1 cell division protein FtsZ [Flavipsychrobacter stenotrophus]
MIHFEIPKNQSSIIKVIGVGGGGSNAVNYMYSLGIEGVDFVVCNTDSQALTLSPVVNKVQLGPHLTAGLGAGANPEIGKQSCEESLEDITKILKVNTRMAFITAGMGGGTGTGGAPVVAKICKDLDILTVGIVTTPFTYEGRKRMKQAQEGIERMREHVDTVLIISNDKLRQQFGNLPFTQAFAKADDILATAAKCITDVITTTGSMNVDFADVCTVMKNGGVAILGSASVSGENRALHAVEQALNSPLLNDSDISGAKWLLLNITSASGEFEHTMDEAEAIQAYVQQQAGDNCDVILGMGHDPNLHDKIAVTVIATGFNYKEINIDMPSRNREPEKISFKLEDINTITNNAPINFETRVEERQPIDMTPTLVEVSEEPAMQFFIKEEVVVEEVAPVVEMTIAPEPIPEPTPVFFYEERKEEEVPMRLVIKKEEPVEDVIIKRGERILTADEIEEQRRFEEQKRALEDRAERLRRMSFNIKGTESTDEIESVPAYMRKNVQLDNSSSSSTQYSGYTVGHDNKGNINTINTFLDGNKPD